MAKTKHGKQLEGYLDALHATYRRAGRAVIAKVPNPVNITKPVKRGIVTGHLLKPVWVDYTGVVAGGIAVALEAKFTAGSRQSWSFSGMSDHQHQTLTSVHKMGGIAALYVRHGRFSRNAKVLVSSIDYLIPIAFIDGLDKRSFRWDEVERYRVPAGRTWMDSVDVGQGCSVETQTAWEMFIEDGWMQPGF